MFSQKLKYFIFTIAIVGAFCSETIAQVTVNLQPIPPYQFKIEQFWKAIITNSGGPASGSINVFLKGTASIQGIADTSMQGKIIEATSSVIILRPGVKIITGRDLGPFTISDLNSRYKDIRLSTGSLPSGNYNICIKVFEAATGRQIASDCISTIVGSFNRMELLSPYDGEIIGNNLETDKDNSKLKTIKRNPTIVFSWLPPVPIPPNANFRYRLKLVEMLSYQSVHSAMASNPIYYQSPIIPSTILRYPLAARQLVPGSKYAWVIEVFINNSKIQESEIRSFEIAGGDKKVVKQTSKNRMSINQNRDTYFNQYTGLPSGLSLSSNKIHGPRNSILFADWQQNNLSDNPSNFKFYGDAKFTYESNNRTSQFSQIPVNYWTLEFNPRVFIHDIPFGLNVYLSSLDNSSAQSINNVSFEFDIEQLKSKITDRIYEKVDELQSSVNLSLDNLNDITSISDPTKIKDLISEKVKEIQSYGDSTLGKLNGTDIFSEKINEIQSSAGSPLEKLTKLEALSDPANLEKLKEIETLSNPGSLVENADGLGLISGAEKFFLDLKSFGIGRTYPDYSELTVSGVEVNGINIEYNPGIFYIAGAAWNNARGIDDISFKRSFLAGRLGIGKKEKGHLFFTLLKMKDDDQSILPPTNLFLTPQQNQVIGTDGKIILFNNLLSLKSEAVISMFTRDLRDADVQNSSLPGFVQSLYNSKISTSYDYALSSSAVFDDTENDTYASIEVKRIGPGYISLAAPNIRSDQMMYEAKFNKKFSEKKIGMKTFVKVYQDNIRNWDPITTTTKSLGVSFNFNFPDIPYFIIGYSNYTQNNDAVQINQKIKNNNHMANFMTGYSYQMSSVYASTMFSFNGQWQNTEFGISNSIFSNQTYMLNQSFNFEFPLTLSTTFSFTQTKILSTTSKITEFDFNGNYLFSESVTVDFGATLSHEENFTKRSFIYIGSNINLVEWLTLQLNGNYSKFRDLTGGGNDYIERMAKVSLLVKW